MAANYNDGSVPYGAYPAVTINSVVYVAEQIDISRPTKKIKRYNNIGEPSGQVFVADFDSGTMTLQMANVTHALPARGLSFSLNVQNNSVNYVVSDVGTPLAQDEAVKVSIGFDRIYN